MPKIDIGEAAVRTNGKDVRFLHKSREPYPS